MAEHYQLKCRECGKLWGNQARSFCEECLSPLEVVYDLDAIRPVRVADLPEVRAHHHAAGLEVLPGMRGQAAVVRQGERKGE